MSKATKEKKTLVALDDVLSSLQKSFSRVSRNAAEVDDTQARAMIVGQVEFTIQANVTPNSDVLLVDDKGVLSLGLKGVIDTDIREESGKSSN